MSNDCSSGTPALIMVDIWRVKVEMSLALIALPLVRRRFFTLVTRMPWRRRTRRRWPRCPRATHRAAACLVGLSLPTRIALPSPFALPL
jgi:hypothetical protein